MVIYLAGEESLVKTMIKLTHGIATLVAVLLLQTHCGAAPQVENNAPFPQHRQLREDGVSVTVYEHKIPGAGNHKAWSIVSDGLEKFGQHEVIISVLQDETEKDSDYPPDLIKFMNTLAMLAKQHRLVEAGGISVLGQSILAPQFKGLIYLPAEHFPDVPMKPHTIAAVPITETELESIALSGPSRLAGRLVRQARFYPYTTWCDRKRTSVFSEDELKMFSRNPMLGAPKITIFDASVAKQKNETTLLINREAAAKLSEKLKELSSNTPVLLSLAVDPRANAYIVWTAPGSKEINAVGPNGSRADILSSAFLSLIPQAKSDQILNAEDATVLFLTNASWDRLVDSLKNAKELVIPVKDASGAGATFGITWTNDNSSLTSYKNPVDGKNYSLNVTASPTTATKTKPEDLGLQEVRLLTDANLLEKLIAVKPLTDYIAAIKTTAGPRLPSIVSTNKSNADVEYQVILQADVTSEGSAKYRMVVQPELQNAEQKISDLTSSLQKITVPASKGPFSFQLIFKVKANE